MQLCNELFSIVIAKLDGVKTYMRMRRVPTHLQVKVIKWFDYLWLTQKCSDEEKAVSCLPDKLKAEIAINVHLDTLKRLVIMFYAGMYLHFTWLEEVRSG